MKNLVLENYGVVEIESSEMVNTDGGCILDYYYSAKSWVKEQYNNCVSEFQNVMKQCHC